MESEEKLMEFIDVLIKNNKITKDEETIMFGTIALAIKKDIEKACEKYKFLKIVNKQ